MKKVFFLSITILMFKCLVGQEDVIPIISPSSEAKQIDRFTFYPVSYATGIPDITVPLYDLIVRDFKMPIQLKYHSGGIKFLDDTPYPIGWGWRLTSSFRITRYQNGEPDEIYNKVSQNEILRIKEEVRNIEQLTYDAVKKLRSYSGCIGPSGVDLEYDIFTVNLPNESFSFVLQQNTSGNVSCTPLNNPRMKVNISGLQKYSNRIIAFDVIDDKGIKYQFGAYINFPATDEDMKALPNDWVLHKIILPNTEEITFKYTNIDISSPYHRSYDEIIGILEKKNEGDSRRVWIKSLGCPQYYTGTDEDPLGYSFYQINNYILLPSQIIFPNGKISFSYENRMIQSIIIESLTEKVQQIDFYRDKDKPYLLSQVKIDGNSPYRFKYDTSTDFIYKNGVDYWGYYNGINNKNRNPIIYQWLCNSNALDKMEPIGSANITSTESTKANILKQIIYPTGGSTTFDYELNEYASNNGTKYQGCGLRIKNMLIYDPLHEKTTTKSYKYGKNENGIGNIILYPSPHHYYNYSYAWSTSLAIFIQGIPVKGEEWWFTVKNLSTGINPMIVYFSTNLPIWYDSVTEYTDNGKIVYKYSYRSDEYDFVPQTKSIVLSRIHRFSQPEPLLLEKTIFNKAEKLVQYESFEYDYSRKEIPGLIIRPLLFDGTTMYYVELALYSRTYLGSNLISQLQKNLPQPFFIQNTSIYSGEIKLISHTVDSYEDGGTIRSVKTNKYDELGRLKSETTQNSMNGTYSTEFEYPEANTALHSKNKLSTIVKKKILRNNNLTEIIELVYQPTKIVPDFMKTSKADQVSRVEFSYDKYDNKNNLLQYRTIDNLNTVYLWSYNGQYPIAEIKNATYDQIETAVASVFGTSIENLSNTKMPDKTKLNNLHSFSGLNHAHVTTYTYQQLKGINSATAPNRLTVSYDYDYTGRLVAIKDNNEKKITEYNYHYIPYPHLVPLLNVKDNYYLNETAEFNLVCEGGSGDFSYDWYIDSTPILSGSNNKLSYQFTKIGKSEIKCIIKDRKQNIQTTRSSLFNVIYQPIRGNIEGNYYNITDTEMIFTAKTSGGSGKFTYDWIIRDDQNNILLKTSTVNNILNTQITKKGKHILSCIVKDVNSMQEEELLRPIFLEVLNVIFSNVKSFYETNSNQTFSVSASSGSGSYSYIWSMTDLYGNVVSTSTQQSFNVTFTNSDSRVISCTVKDLIKKGEETITKTINPVTQVLKFIQLFHQEDDIFATTGARFTLKEKSSVTFKALMLKNPNDRTGNLKVYFGNTTFWIYEHNGYKQQTVTLGPGTYSASIELIGADPYKPNMLGQLIIMEATPISGLDSPYTIEVRFEGNNLYNSYRSNVGDQVSQIQTDIEDTTNAFYLWSYSDQYAVAKIENATYKQIEEVLGGDSEILRIQNVPELSINDLTKLNSLRSKLPNALVTTYTYKPMVGMLSATDPSGKTKYYEYDVSNKLKRIYIKEGTAEKDIQAYDYH